MDYRVHQLEARRDTGQELEETGYIAVNKTFVERMPRTFVAATAEGRIVFREHTAALESTLKSM